MMKIGLISDTHSYLDPQVKEYFSGCDEIWHAGDFGNIEVVEALKKIAPVRGVYGNIDGQNIRQEFDHELRFELEGVDFYMIHIGGNPGRYAIPIRDKIQKNPPDVMICGHSHILKIVRDKEKGNMLFINPGAAGRHGFQVQRTIVRFHVENGKLSDMEVIVLEDD